MAKSQSKGETADYIFLECDADHSFEKTAENSKWINRIDGGLELPENSLLSVQYAGINIRGSGTDVIEFKNEKIGESEFFEYNKETSLYEKNKYDVYDNKVTVFLEFYKNQDGLYNYSLPYPYYNYSPTTYSENFTSLDNKKDTLKEEVQFGVTSSTYNSIYNFAFPIDNKRYTILERNENQIYTGEDNGREHNGVRFSRDISRYEYSVFHNKVELEVDKGFVSPSSVAEQISQQLEKHGSPNIKTMRCWTDEPTAGQAWTNDYKDIQGGLTCETETFKLFKCATRRSFYKYAYDHYHSIAGNNDTEVEQYQKNFQYIGCYNPELFLYSRSILYDENFDGFQQLFVFLIQIDCSPATEEGMVEYEMFTNIPYNEETLSQSNKIFNYERNDSELYENKVAKYTNSTPNNSVFLHVDCYNINYNDLASFKHRRFGTDYSASNNPTLFTNPLYLTCDTSITGYNDTNAYGVFEPWLNNQKKKYVKVKGRFHISIRPADNSDPNNPIPKLNYFTFYNNQINSKYNGTLTITKEQYTDASFPLNNNYYSRIGWDRHFSAQGNQCILLWNGLAKYNALEVNVIHKDKTDKDPERKYIYENSFVLNGDEGDQAQAHMYYYDTGNDEIYLGADSFLFNFDNNESRFNMSGLHTARKQFNNALSGFDPSILSGVGVDDSGNPEIYYLPNLLGVEQQGTNTAFPLDINGNGNTAIYEVSPTSLLNSTQEVSEAYKDLKSNTIFDSNCGIFISNYGVTDDNFTNSLWDILGFSKTQIKTYMVNTLGEEINLNRNHRFLNLGVNLKDKPVYPFTTNAQINSNEIISWKTNPFNNSYFNTLSIPNNFRMLVYESRQTYPAQWLYQDRCNQYRIIQNQTSTLMFANILPSKSNIPFYQVRSDIIPVLKYYGGDNQSNGRLPVVAIVNKSMAGADYFVNQGDNSMEYIIKKRIVLNTVTTEIFDNYGRPAILDEHSSVIFRIQLPYNEPNVTPFSNLGELEEAEEEQKKQK